MDIECFQYSIEKTNSYLLIQDGHGAVIDPCSNDLVNELLKKNLIIDFVAITHEHCDHLWGLNYLKDAFKCPLISTNVASLAIQDPRFNRAKDYHIYLALKYGEITVDEDINPAYKCDRSEIEFSEEFSLSWRGERIYFRHSPGHSKGSCLIKPMEGVIISGDTVLKGEHVFTGFEGGSQTDFEEYTLPFLRKLRPDTRILPGHGESFFLGDYSYD